LLHRLYGVDAPAYHIMLYSTQIIIQTAGLAFGQHRSVFLSP